MRKFLLWLTGRDVLPPPPAAPLPGEFFQIPPPTPVNWELTFDSGGRFRINLPGAPNAIHRLAQRCLLGFRWKMVGPKEGR